jgi:hypothetical protein
MGYKKLSRRIELMQTTVKCICMVPDRVMNKKHDALYCKQCDAWIEPICSKFDCKYCKDRPARPSEVKHE